MDLDTCFVPCLTPTRVVSMRLTALHPTAWLIGLLLATLAPTMPVEAQVRSRTVTVSPRNRTVTRDTTTAVRVSPFATAVAEVLRLTNVERATAGCPPLVVHDSLAAAATAHSEDMASHGELSHTGSDGRTAPERARDAGYDFRRIAENVAAGQPDAPGVMRAWMNSPGHRTNILDCALTDVGIGVARSAEGPSREIYWTQLFGTSR